jgi:hypothetical protein
VLECLNIFNIMFGVTQTTITDCCSLRARPLGERKESSTAEQEFAGHGERGQARLDAAEAYILESISGCGYAVSADGRTQCNLTGLRKVTPSAADIQSAVTLAV